jgi:hypothetical protein
VQPVVVEWLSISYLCSRDRLALMFNEMNHLVNLGLLHSQPTTFGEVVQSRFTDVLLNRTSGISLQFPRRRGKRGLVFFHRPRFFPRRTELSFGEIGDGYT